MVIERNGMLNVEEIAPAIQIDGRVHVLAVSIRNASYCKLVEPLFQYMQDRGCTILNTNLSAYIQAQIIFILYR